MQDFASKYSKFSWVGKPTPSPHPSHLHGPRYKDYQNFGRASSILGLLALWTSILKKLVSNHAVNLERGDTVQVTMAKPYIKYKIISSSRS